MTVGTYLARELMMPRALEISKEIWPAVWQRLLNKYGYIPRHADHEVLRHAINRARDEAIAEKTGKPVFYWPI